MSIRINAQIDAFRAERNLELVAADFERAVGRLSSGLRIRGAADDPSGLSASQKLHAQSTGFEQAGRNASELPMRPRKFTSWEPTHL